MVDRNRRPTAACRTKTAFMAGTRRSTTRASRRVSGATVGPAGAAGPAPSSDAAASGRPASTRSNGSGSAREMARTVRALSSTPVWVHPLTGEAGMESVPSTSTTLSRGRLDAYLTMLRETVTSSEKRTSCWGLESVCV